MSVSKQRKAKSPTWVFVLLGVLIAGFAVLPQTPLWEELLDTQNSQTRGGRLWSAIEELDPLQATLVIAAIAVLCLGVAVVFFLRNRKLKRQG